MTLSRILFRTTPFRITVSDALGSSVFADVVLLAPNHQIFLDYDGDGCNTLADLQLPAQEWRSRGGSDTNIPNPSPSPNGPLEPHLAGTWYRS